MPNEQPGHHDILGTGTAERERLLEQCLVYEPETRWLLDQLNIRPGWRVIDIGCGPLGILDLLASRVSLEGAVVELEREPRMLEWAGLSVAERNLTNVQLVDGDATASSLPPESFDLVHERLVLINVPQPEQLLQVNQAIHCGNGQDLFIGRRVSRLLQGRVGGGRTPGARPCVARRRPAPNTASGGDNALALAPPRAHLLPTSSR